MRSLPKPYRILSAIRDFLSHRWRRQAFEEASRVYAKIGAAAQTLHVLKPTMATDYTHPRRMAGYEWFARWLKGEEDKRPEPEIQLATFQDLQCTPNGQGWWILRTPRRFSRSIANARVSSSVPGFRRTNCAIAFAS